MIVTFDTYLCQVFYEARRRFPKGHFFDEAIYSFRDIEYHDPQLLNKNFRALVSLRVDVPPGFSRTIRPVQLKLNEAVEPPKRKLAASSRKPAASKRKPR